MKRLNVNISDQEMEELLEMARSREMTKTQLVREWIRSHRRSVRDVSQRMTLSTPDLDTTTLKKKQGILSQHPTPKSMNNLSWQLLNRAPVSFDPQWKYASLHRCLMAIRLAVTDLKYQDIPSLEPNIEQLEYLIENAVRVVNLDQYPEDSLCDMEVLISDSVDLIPLSLQGAIAYWDAVKLLVGYGVRSCQ